MNDMIPLENRLREQASASGADYFGVANLSPANELVRELSGEMLVRFPRAISIGVKMPTTIVDQLSHHDDKAVALAYRSHGYEIINIRLNQVASRLSSILQREGHRDVPWWTDDDLCYGINILGMIQIIQ